MKNYQANESGWFDTSIEEITQQSGFVIDLEAYGDDVAKLKNHFHAGFRVEGELLDIISYIIVDIPSQQNEWDKAVLLCVLLSNGKYMAKRHVNSQWLSLDY